MVEHDFSFPMGSLPFLENIRQTLSTESLLVFSDFLEENGKQKIAELFRRIAEKSKTRSMKKACLGNGSTTILPTLVAEGTKLKGYIGKGYRRGVGWSHFGARLGIQIIFTATRTRGGFLRWEYDKTEELPSIRVVDNTHKHLFVNIKPCSFADRLLKNPSLKYR